MHTIFAIAPTRNSLESLLDSLEANAVALRNATLVLPDRGETTLPEGASTAQPAEDDFSGNVRYALIGSIAGALFAMLVYAIPSWPGLVAAGIGTRVFDFTIVALAGAMIGTMVGLEIPEPAGKHYQTRLGSHDRMIALRVPSSQVDEFVGLFKREGMEDIAIHDDKIRPDDELSRLIG